MGKHSVDCFANQYNKKINRYFSRFWILYCSGVDFFVQNLSGQNCLLVRPKDLIIRTLHYLYACRATNASGALMALGTILAFTRERILAIIDILAQGKNHTTLLIKRESYIYKAVKMGRIIHLIYAS